MDDDVAKVDDDPTIIRTAFALPMQFKYTPGLIHHGIGQGIQHAVAGTVHQNEIICKC